MTHIIMGSTVHARYEPVKHQFKYPLYMIQTDINDLNKMDQSHGFLDTISIVSYRFMIVIFCIQVISQFLKK